MNTTNRLELVNNKLNRLKKMDLNFEAWIFGSYLTKIDDFNDIDIALLVKSDKVKLKLSNILKKLYPKAIIEEALNYGGGSPASKNQFHFLLLTESNKAKKSSIYQSINKGLLLWEN